MLGGMLVFIPLALSDALAAYILWGWSTVLSPVYYLYGFMGDLRFNFIFAAIALLLLFVKRRNKQPFKVNSTFILILALLAHSLLSALLGYPFNPFNAILGEQFFKSILFCLVMYWFVIDRHDMYALLVMFGLGLGFHGVLEGIKVIASAGSHKVSGIPTSMMSDNNHFAVGMVVVLPILYYLYQYSSRALVRYGFLAGFFLTIVSVLGTNSRGGVVALGVVGIWFFHTSRHKLKTLLLIGIAAAMVFALAPESWFSRMDSIGQAGEDSSFMGRVVAWKISSAIALQNPIFGGGFHAVQLQHVWDQFRYSDGLLGSVTTPVPELVARAAHSIYFEIMGDLGFFGLLLFLGVFLNSLVARYHIKLLIERAPERYIWALDMADALMLAILAYLAGGAAVSLGYFEIPYMLVMLMEILRQYVKNETLAAPGKIQKKNGAP
ncbi:MAG: putative O-glycosylation ligase, exosortase A system-associated [Candidatus Accumulibacter sp.]|nr:putative O-glycosylation ligase, exosortase A system-associated [Accumulibacter sp.]